MENARNKLKILSYILLCFALYEVAFLLYSFLKMKERFAEYSDLFNSLPILIIAGGLVLVFYIAPILASLYVAVAGLKNSKEPSTKKLHIILAKIEMAICILALLFRLSDVISNGNDVESVVSLLVGGFNICVLLQYVKYAGAVRSFAFKSKKRG